jgi:hypothetical protein
MDHHCAVDDKIPLGPGLLKKRDGLIHAKCKDSNAAQAYQRHIEFLFTEPALHLSQPPPIGEKRLTDPAEYPIHCLGVCLVLSDIEKRAACQNQSSQRCERHENLLHVDIASFFKSLFSASRTGYIRYAIAGSVNLSNSTFLNIVLCEWYEVSIVYNYRCCLIVILPAYRSQAFG